jgi:tetratricopeptide (TPR) repeat protein
LQRAVIRETLLCFPLLQVKNTFNNMDYLINEIIVERKRWHKIGEPLAFTVFNISNDVEKSSAHINGTFLHTQLLIDLLLRLKSTDVDRQKFIDLCRKEYVGKQSILDRIDEFEQDYSDEYALWWYTRDIFVYRQLNQALRWQNIDWLFHFRFFIRAIYDLLKVLQKEQQKSLSTDPVYRSQLISSDELMQLKNSIGGLVSFNSFFSTSRNREHTLFLLGHDPTMSSSLHPVLFEIKVNNQMSATSKPFADITKMSTFADDEQEILFMIGTVFRLEEIFMEDRVTVLKMTLCSDDDHDLNTLFKCMKEEIGAASDDSLLTLGTLLWKSARFDQAEHFYRQMLTEIQSDDQLVQNCYQGLGFVAAAKGDFDNGLMWHTKVLEHGQQSLSSDDYRMGCTHNSIGNMYWRMKKYDLALQSYSDAIKIFGQYHDRDVGSCLNNIGIVYEEMKEYKKALEYHRRAIGIRESILPPNHPELGTSHNNTANVYRQLGELSLARSHIKCALNIFGKSLRSNDPSIATAYQNLAAIELACGANREGLRYLEQAAAIFRETLPPNHPTVENSLLAIAQVMMDMLSNGFQFV